MANITIISPSTTIDALNRALDTPALDPVILSIANEYLAGKSVDNIADNYGVSRDRVVATLDKKEVRTYIDGVYATQGYFNRNKLNNLINTVIEQKVAEGLETGILSKKDLLDWVKLLSDMNTAQKPKGPAVAVQVNNYTKLMNELFEG